MSTIAAKRENQGSNLHKYPWRQLSKQMLAVWGQNSWNKSNFPGEQSIKYCLFMSLNGGRLIYL